MIAILEPSEYGAWLSCPVGEAMGFLKQHPGPFECWAAPLPSRAKGPKPPASPKAGSGDLF